jgi:hypothetical protein
MATYVWTLQGTAPTVIDATDIIQFAGAVFGAALFLNNYQDSMHVKSNAGANDSLANAPHNTKFIAAGTVQIDGGATVALNTVTTAECPLKINFSHGIAVIVEDHFIYAYNGTDTAVAPTEVDFKIAEQGNAAWTSAGGSAAALAVADQGSATSHDFFFAISAAGTAVGLKQDFVIRDELIYS